MRFATEFAPFKKFFVILHRRIFRQIIAKLNIKRRFFIFAYIAANGAVTAILLKSVKNACLKSEYVIK